MSEWLPKLIVEENWISLVFFVMVLLLVFLKIQYPHRYNYLFNKLEIKNYFNLYGKDTDKILVFFNILFIIILLAIISFYLFFAAKLYRNIEGLNNYLYIFFSLFLVIIVRHFILSFFFFLLKIKNFTEQFLFETITCQFVIGIFSIPLLFIYYYSFLYSKVFFNTISILFVSLFLIVQFIIIARHFRILIIKNIFFLFCIFAVLK